MRRVGSEVWDAMHESNSGRADLSIQRATKCRNHGNYERYVRQGLRLVEDVLVKIRIRVSNMGGGRHEVQGTRGMQLHVRGR